MYKRTNSYLYNRRARVLVDGKLGQKILLRQGVPQGGVLSSTLFILYTNDLVLELPNGVQSALYGDDLNSNPLYTITQNTTCEIDHGQ